VRERDDLLDPWREALGRLADGVDVHCHMTGRCTRILRDVGLLEPVRPCASRVASNE
jgi:hypothetical protein